MCASDRTEVRVDGREAEVTMLGADGLFRASAAALDETVPRVKPAALAAAGDSDDPGLARWASGFGLAAPTPTVDRRPVTALAEAPVFLSAPTPAEPVTMALSLRADLAEGFWSSSAAPTLGALRCPILDVEAVDRCTEVDERVGLFRLAEVLAPGP